MSGKITRELQMSLGGLRLKGAQERCRIAVKCCPCQIEDLGQKLRVTVRGAAQLRERFVKTAHSVERIPKLPAWLSIEGRESRRGFESRNRALQIARLIPRLSQFQPKSKVMRA